MRGRAPAGLASLAMLLVGSCAGWVSHPRVDAGGRAIFVEVADSPQEWTRGLSGRESLPEGRGMLFIFPDRGLRTFWMKDMRFPLDIIWIDGDRVAGIARDLPPEGEVPSRTYVSSAPVDRVLEVPGGMAARWGIREGDRLTIRP